MKKLTLLTLALGAFVFVNAQVISSSTNQTVTLTLQNKIEISVEGSPTGNTFTFDDVADYESGIINLNASTFKVRSNQNFAVSVASNTATFTTTAATPMDANKLSVRVNGQATFIPLSTTAAALTSGSRGGNNQFSVDYKADPGYSNDAGSYSLVVVYTATQQ